MTRTQKLAAVLLFGLASAAAAAPLAEPATRARAAQGLAVLFSDEDYPASAVRDGEQGAVGFRLGVGPDGRPSGCTVTNSSGSQSLDSTTCRVLMERSRFEPARDSKGKAVADEVAGRIVWKLPDDAMDRPEAAFSLWGVCVFGEAAKLALSDLPATEIVRKSYLPCVALEAVAAREAGPDGLSELQRSMIARGLEDMVLKPRAVLKAPPRP
jgi:TonB family protein